MLSIRVQIHRFVPLWDTNLPSQCRYYSRSTLCGALGITEHPVGNPECQAPVSQVLVILLCEHHFRFRNLFIYFSDIIKYTEQMLR